VHRMTDRQSQGDEPTATYEIRIRGTSTEPLRKQFPSATVLTTRTETVLFRSVEQPAELDALIEQLLSMGLVLTEVHELRLPQTTVVDPDRPAGREGVPDDDF
jgi:hypothetical protein